MSIKDILEKIKPFYMLIVFLVFLSILVAFWRLSVLNSQKNPIKIEYKGEMVGNTALSAVVADGAVVGSKSGKKYYFPWCGTVSRIKSENQVHFASAMLARESGYVPGGNCKGLK